MQGGDRRLELVGTGPPAACDRVLAGEALNRITTDWNDRGVQTAGGENRWRPRNLKRILVGMSEKREMPLVAGGANWDAILTADEVALLAARLNARISATFPRLERAAVLPVLLVEPNRHRAAGPMTRAAIYVRISQDREGLERGIDRQEADCRKLAKKLGWDVADVYSDNDISATSGRPRPAWERLLKDLEKAGTKEGTVDAVLAYSSSRMYRRVANLAQLLARVKDRGIQIETVASGKIDLKTADGRMMAGILASIDQGEVERTGERVRRTKAQQRAAGIHNGGGRRAFGYTKERVVVPAEAALIAAVRVDVANRTGGTRTGGTRTGRSGLTAGSRAKATTPTKTGAWNVSAAPSRRSRGSRRERHRGSTRRAGFESGVELGAPRCSVAAPIRGGVVDGRAAEPKARPPAGPRPLVRMLDRGLARPGAGGPRDAAGLPLYL